MLILYASCIKFPSKKKNCLCNSAYVKKNYVCYARGERKEKKSSTAILASSVAKDNLKQIWRWVIFSGHVCAFRRATSIQQLTQSLYETRTTQYFAFFT